MNNKEHIYFNGDILFVEVLERRNNGVPIKIKVDGDVFNLNKFDEWDKNEQPFSVEFF